MKIEDKKKAYALLKDNPKLLDFLGVYGTDEYQLFREFGIDYKDGHLIMALLVNTANRLTDNKFFEISDCLGFELLPRFAVSKQQKMRIAICFFRRANV